MNIQIKEATDKTYPNVGRYVCAELVCGKHSAIVQIVEGKGTYPAHVRVIVQNAANRAWRGLGKRFDTVAAALANYKTPEVRAMIEAVATMAGQAAAGEINQCLDAQENDHANA